MNTSDAKNSLKELQDLLQEHMDRYKEVFLKTYEKLLRGDAARILESIRRAADDDDTLVGNLILVGTAGYDAAIKAVEFTFRTLIEDLERLEQENSKDGNE